MATLKASSLPLLVRSLSLAAMDLKDCFFALFGPLLLFGRGVCEAGMDGGVRVRRARSMEEMEASFCSLVSPVGVAIRMGVERAILSR